MKFLVKRKHAIAANEEETQRITGCVTTWDRASDAQFMGLGKAVSTTNAVFNTEGPIL